MHSLRSQPFKAVGHRRHHVLCRVSTRQVSSAQERLLNSYWKARGIFNDEQRLKLVGLAMDSLSDGDESDGAEWAPLDTSKPLPGVPVTWDHESGTPEEVMEVSRRLLLLHQLLGGSPSDQDDQDFSPPAPGSASVAEVVFMVMREPVLLTTDSSQLMRRLIQMKVASAGKGVDVVRCVVRQPALLTSDTWNLEAVLNNTQDSSTSGSTNNSSSSDEGSTAYTIHGPSTPLNPLLPPLNMTSPASAPQARTLSDSATANSRQHSTETAGPETAADYAASYGYGYGNESGYGYAQETDQAASSQLPTSSYQAASNSTQGSDGVGQLAGAEVQEADGGGAAHVRDHVYEMIRAWEHGLSSDGDKEWTSRFKQLAAYVQRHGDAGVGFRDEPQEAELGRWAAKQRSDHKKGLMPDTRRDALAALGFEFDDNEAEWVRWYTELCAFTMMAGHSSPYPLSQGVDLRLINWVSIQRIARRSGVLPASRIDRLDQLQFDWTGADPLS